MNNIKLLIFTPIFSLLLTVQVQGQSNANINNLLKDFQTEITQIEDTLQKLKASMLNLNSEKKTEEVIFTTLHQEIDSNEQYIIEKYYIEPNFLEQYAYKVTPTKKTLENIYLNQPKEIIFQESNQSDYWILQLTSGGFCLLPDLNFKINTNLKTVKTIFELQNYQEHLSTNFKVIKTAKVNEINNQWLLIDKGILEFDLEFKKKDIIK